MTKTKIGGMNSDDIFDMLNGVDEAPQPAKKAGDKKKAYPVKKAQPIKAEVEVPLIGRKYMLPQEIVDALDRRAYRDKSKNLSQHVQAALEVYLKEDIKAIRNGEL